MMTRTLIAATLAAGLLLGSASLSYAQVTDQTDQSEEDWRKSRKKSGDSDIFTPNRTTNGNGLGTIIDVEPVSPVERLPSDSRRHLMRERAKAIAESPDGNISDAEYVPSEEAQNDPALMQDEKEAWEVITTDMEGAGGQADTPSQGGPNKVAVTGRNGTAPAPGSQSGSTATLQEIMDAIKAGRMGNGGSGGGSGVGSGGGTGSQPGTGSGARQAPSGNPAGAGTQPQGTPGGAGAGQSQTNGDGEASANAEGEGQSDGQGDAQGTTQSASAGGQDGSASAANGQNGAQSGSDGSDSGQSGAAAADGETRTARSREDLSPLERMRQSREDREATGTKRSASDYIGGGQD